MIPGRPVLRWHGGKWMLAPWIISHFPEHRIYVEPWGGAASVLLRKPRVYAEVYNDLDDEVVNLFRLLQSQDSAKRLVELLILTPFSRKEFDLSFRRHGEPVERARRLIIRSFMGFGSDASTSGRKSLGSGKPPTGFRSNSDRSGTTPAHDWANYPDCLRQVIERWRGVVIESRPALEVFGPHDTPDTLFYCDPPYLHGTRSDARGEYAHEMSDDDHRIMLKVLKSVKGFVVLSGYPNACYDPLGWHKVEKNSLADGALKRVEVLWINPRCWEAVKSEKGIFF